MYRYCSIHLANYNVSNSYYLKQQWHNRATSKQTTYSNRCYLKQPWHRGLHYNKITPAVVATESNYYTKKLHLHKNAGGCCIWVKENWIRKLTHIHVQYIIIFDAQNCVHFLIYAWNVLGGSLGGEILIIVLAAKITVHVHFQLTHGATCYLYGNIPIDDYNSHVSIL